MDNGVFPFPFLVSSSISVVTTSSRKKQVRLASSVANDLAFLTTGSEKEKKASNNSTNPASYFTGGAV